MKNGEDLEAGVTENVLMIMNETNRRYGELARELNTTYWEIYNPLNNRTKCGISTAKKLRDFIHRNRRFI